MICDGDVASRNSNSSSQIFNEGQQPTFTGVIMEPVGQMHRSGPIQNEYCEIGSQNWPIRTGLFFDRWEESATVLEIGYSDSVLLFMILVSRILGILSVQYQHVHHSDLDQHIHHSQYFTSRLSTSLHLNWYIIGGIGL